VESTIIKILTFDRASLDDGSSTTKHLTEPFPVAQFIANLRLLPNLRCYTPFDSLKSVEDVKAEYLIDNAQNS
jgi:hypothetical protein